MSFIYKFQETMFTLILVAVFGTFIHLNYIMSKPLQLNLAFAGEQLVTTEVYVQPQAPLQRYNTPMMDGDK